MSSHFCAGCFIVCSPEGQFYVLGATDERFKKDVKFPGGTKKKLSLESGDQTLVREFTEETGLIPTAFRRFFVEEENDFRKFFYQITRIESDYDLTYSYHYDGPDGEKLEIHWWPIEEFNRALYSAQRPVFNKILDVLKNDPKFQKNHKPLCEI